MSVIFVKNLSKYYQVHQKEPGFLGSIKSLLKRKYRNVKAVDHISFSIEKGELVGFIGPNGAGKTTTLKCLSGLLYPTSGEINVFGFNPQQRKEKFLKNISFIMGQKNQLWWDLPPIETFLLNKEIYEISSQKFKETLTELVKLLAVENILKIPVRKLSLGQRLKCELIASLLHQPKVLFLDEPTIGLDVIAQKKMHDFIKIYNHKYQAAILLTSHYMGDVHELCKRVIIIDKGKIIYDGKLTKIVEKYAHHKILTAVFAKEIDPKGLAEIGEIKDYAFPKAVISVLRSKTSGASSRLLAKFPVADLTIEEPKIEDIIRKIFESSAEPHPHTLLC